MALTFEEGGRERILQQARTLAEAEETPAGEPITKADLFALGLSGGSGSAERRKALAKALDLPEHLSPNALLDVLNLLTTREELAETVYTLAGEGTSEE